MDEKREMFETVPQHRSHYVITLSTVQTCVWTRHTRDERDMQMTLCNNTSLDARGVLTQNVMTTELVLANKITSIPNLSTAAGTTGVVK